MNLQNKTFSLIDNQKGLAASQTRMTFNNHSVPFQAVYSGPNIISGHALVTGNGSNLKMIYHALTSTGDLVAGKAKVSFIHAANGNLTMQLNWQWLTGDLSFGISVWSEISAK